ncbi:MAG: hypothetical protein GY729_19885 [Desulfobacteraceae bacterium]|nr:hypothetical protein [Desulfobacteraceae bacterium]
MENHDNHANQKKGANESDGFDLLDDGYANSSGGGYENDGFSEDREFDEDEQGFLGDENSYEEDPDYGQENQKGFGLKKIVLVMGIVMACGLGFIIIQTLFFQKSARTAQRFENNLKHQPLPPPSPQSTEQNKQASLKPLAINSANNLSLTANTPSVNVEKTNKSLPEIGVANTPKTDQTITSYTDNTLLARLEERLDLIEANQKKVFVQFDKTSQKSHEANALKEVVKRKEQRIRDLEAQIQNVGQKSKKDRQALEDLKEIQGKYNWLRHQYAQKKEENQKLLSQISLLEGASKRAFENFIKEWKLSGISGKRVIFINTNQKVLQLGVGESCSGITIQKIDSDKGFVVTNGGKIFYNAG